MSQSRDFYKYVDVRLGGCWLWKGSTTIRKGVLSSYGKIRYEGKPTHAHRVAYILEYGPYKEGLDIDHLCRTPLCVNPLHLEACTRKQNVRRGAVVKKKDFCKRGHPQTKENRSSYNNRYVCRLCVNYRASEKRRIAE